ncbi:MAG: YheC/YheD family protein [Peptococcaceae bacterium]|nr:YheC/YheD family protein [Peptococcaceae bacterium]
MRVVRVSIDAPSGAREDITVRGGASEARARLIAQGEKWVLQVRPVDIVALGLHEGQQVALWPDAEGWRIGPYIGIMTVLRPSARGGFCSLSGKRDNYDGLARIGREYGAVVFVFAAENMYYRQKRVLGYGRNAARQWVAREYPWPDVIYNRVPDRTSEGKRTVTLAKRRFTEQGGALFNPGFLNKWQLHAWLSQDDALARYLPGTRLLRSATDLLRMLKEHQMVYLKPVSSFAGQGIFQLRTTGNGFLLRYREGTQMREEHCVDFRGLLQTVSLRKQPGTYIVQQGLSLAMYQGAIFDVRVLVQKGAAGTWDLTGIGVRVAGRGGITTHVPCGGYIAPVEKILRDVFGEKPDTKDGIYQRVKKLALAIAPTIEKHMRQELGEMSMDIGITKKGECYFFEANAKPMKFDEPHIRRLSLCRLVEYSSFLAGKRVTNGASHAGN